jgi:hypothetical protein
LAESDMTIDGPPSSAYRCMLSGAKVPATAVSQSVPVQPN